MSEFYDNLETRSQDERDDAALTALRQQLKHARSNAPAYESLLANHPASALQTLSDYSSVPVTRKSALIEQQRQLPPFGGLVAVPMAELAHVYASPGPIYEADSWAHDHWRFARWLHAAGIRRGDLIHNTFSYHLTPAGLMMESGARALGCPVIPAGVGQTELQVQTIAALRPVAYIGTPSFLKIILDKADEMAADVSSLKIALVSGEALPPSIRAGFLQRGIQTLQAYATADLGLIAYESPAQEGLIIDEGIYLEIVRPGTGDPVAEGEVGEVVVTTFNSTYPLIRFATGDLSAILPGISPCGRTNRRIRGWMGRADQTAKVRGMFIHPEQIAAVVARHPQISRARLVIEWHNDADVMTLRCETDSGTDSLRSAVADSMRELCKLRSEVEFLSPAALPNDGIVIEDVRQYD